MPLVITPPILFAVAVALDRRRDTDEGIIRDSGTATARLRLLRSPLGFAWRERVGGLLGWGLGLLAFGFVLGAITKAFVDFIAADPDIADLTAEFGFTSLTTPIGFVASMDAIVHRGRLRLRRHRHRPAVGGRAVRPPRPGVRGACDAYRWLGAGAATTADGRGVVDGAPSASAPGSGSRSPVSTSPSWSRWGPSPTSARLVVLFLGLAVMIHGTFPKWTVADRRRRRGRALPAEFPRPGDRPARLGSRTSRRGSTSPSRRPTR